MASITTRAGKGAPLSNAEVDSNFTNLNDELGTKLPFAGGTMSGKLVVGAAGTTSDPVLRLNNSSSAAFVHTQEALAANLTAGQTNISLVGKSADTKNSGYLGYYWDGAASNSNFVSIGHWGADHLFRVYGDGNVTVGTNSVLHAGNYSSYAPTLTGTGASGTWGISISGNAATATALQTARTINGVSFDGTANITITAAANGGNADTVDSLHASDFMRTRGTTNSNIDSDWGEGVVTFDPIPTGTPPISSPNIRVLNLGNDYNRRTQVAFNYSTDQTWFRRKHDASWGSWREYLHSGNYNSYSPTLTGSGASGTWGINITGYADSAGSATNQSGGTVSATTGAFSSTITSTLAPAAINTTTPGLANYGYVFNGTSSADNAQAITWTWASGGGAQAGIYVQSSGAYGTKMYLATTDSFATGAKTAVSIDHSGNVNLNRGTFSNGSVWINNGANYNGYNENIRLFNAPNGVSVIAFSASGASGTPTTSVLGFSDRWEVRYNNDWQQRSYNGYVEAAGSFRAPIFYDSNNTGYYVDPASRSRLASMDYGDGGYYFAGGDWGYRHNTPYGWIQFGPANSGHAHIYTDRSNFYFNVETSASIAYGRDSSRAPIFYDSNDTTYYVDPAGNGTRAAYLNGNLWINPKSESYGEGVTFYMPSQSTWGGLRWYRNGPGGGYSGNWAFGYFGNEANNDIGFHNGTNGWRLDHSFHNTVVGSVRSPIFYDSNDTGYYCDPNSTSRFNRLRVGDGSSSWIDMLDDESPNGVKYLHANSNYLGFVSGYGGWVFRCDNGGNTIAEGNVTAYSDERLKTDWAPLAADFVDRLAEAKSGTYTRISNGKRQAGSSAQDWLVLLPEVVEETNDEAKTLALAYGNAALVSAIELAKRVVAQEARIAQLEATIQTLIGDRK